jgi:hypothetical protein
MRETTERGKKKTLIRLSRDILPEGGKGKISLRDVVPCE